MSGNSAIVWFRRDLRLADNPALAAAVKSSRSIVPVFVLDDRTKYCWDTGGASRWWLHYSLEALEEALRKIGGFLVLRRGDSEAELARLIEECGATELHYSRGSGPEAKALEQRIENHLGDKLELHGHYGHLLMRPGTIRSTTGTPYKVFTPFWHACRERADPDPPLSPPSSVRVIDQTLRSDALADWRLAPSSPDWAGGLKRAWTPGERGATERFGTFLEQVQEYDTQRDRPDNDGTSRLSPYLHFGEISPRQLWHDIHAACDVSRAGAGAFLRQLYWREFCHHLLQEFPAMPSQPLREEFAKFPWSKSESSLRSWQRGQTGYPIVDAGMRQLMDTGWMHNRVRMLVASFLVKHLLIPWQDGAAWFQDTLVDADEANNSANWQWVAGCGTDAAPYFRIFNPVLQGRKFDPDGSYTRYWVPELDALDTSVLHAPWEAPTEALQSAGITLGKTYPRPLVEHKAARERALEAFRRSKSS